MLPLKVMPGVEEGPGQTYVVLARPPGSMALGRFLNILRFRIKEIDPTTGEARCDAVGVDKQETIDRLGCACMVHAWHTGS